jgi:TRAP-type C4-dicarboxylate transport system permease small subunit
LTQSLDTEPAPERTTRFDRVAERIENAALTLTMAALVGVAAVQLVLRSVFSTTLVWADEFQRIVVLWLALLGAVAAARTDRHLRIDVVHKLLGPRLRELVSALASLVVVAVAAVLSYEAARFTAQAYSFGDTVMGDVKQWPFLLIMPLAFGLISLYYLRNAVRQTLRAVRGDEGRAG